MNPIRTLEFTAPEKVQDPEVKRLANELLAAGLDALGQPLTAEQRVAAMPELLAVFDLDAARFLAALYSRYKTGRIEQPGADVPSEVQAARWAFENVAQWAAEIQGAWSAQQLGVAPGVESVAAQRLDRAITSGPRALRQLLTAVAANSGDVDAAMAMARLCEESANNFDLEPGVRAQLNGFVSKIRPPLVTTAIELSDRIADYRDKTVGFAGFMTRTPAA